MEASREEKHRNQETEASTKEKHRNQDTEASTKDLLVRTVNRKGRTKIWKLQVKTSQELRNYPS